MTLVYWPLMVDVWYSEEGTGLGRSLPRSLFAVPNVKVHQAASVPISVLLYSGPMLCSFNAPIKGLSGSCSMYTEALPLPSVPQSQPLSRGRIIVSTSSPRHVTRDLGYRVGFMVMSGLTSSCVQVGDSTHIQGGCIGQWWDIHGLVFSMKTPYRWLKAGRPGKVGHCWCM